MTATIFDAYGEDGDFEYMNGSIGAGVTIHTTGNFFRAAYARCAVGFYSPAQVPVFGTRFWACGPKQTAWFGMRVYISADNDTSQPMFGFVDSSGRKAISMEPLANSQLAFNIVKIALNGTRTVLGTTTSGLSLAGAEPDQVSFNFDYATDGFLKIYVNRSIIFNFSGDITTDGLTELGGTWHANFQNGAAENVSYSECILSDSDTRDMSLATLAGASAGTVDQWTGDVSNVNEIAVNDANFDTTTTSGDVQRYKMSALTTGNYDIAAKITSLRATLGGGNLTKIALAELLGGSEFTTAQQDFPTAFGSVTFVQGVNPATGNPWTQTDINAATRESGYKTTT